VNSFFGFAEPTPPRTFRWELITDDKFKTISFSVVPEKRGNNIYWYMRKSRQGKTVNLYVGPAGSLSAELLDNAAKNVLHKLPAQNMAKAVQS
jgi:hypothetical protein